MEPRETQQLGLCSTTNERFCTLQTTCVAARLMEAMQDVILTPSVKKQS